MGIGVQLTDGELRPSPWRRLDAPTPSPDCISLVGRNQARRGWPTQGYQSWLPSWLDVASRPRILGWRSTPPPPGASVLLEMTSTQTHQRLAIMGAAFFDSYDPLIEFVLDVVAIDAAARITLRDRLEGVLPEGEGGQNNPRL